MYQTFNQGHNRRVTLAGTMRTRLFRELATSEAYELGARDVNNYLLVEQQPSCAL
ncbi:hypothetical protein [Hymenobacter swuensis]|uniref:Uncharacterized protein n=1 Tax=Hymenobacter swuensis DY53 TaxID=1227739 RepID=W8EYC9_9BACT|nr:hypothetical protein [Hymenobacter swuensis]AHJ95361.1 hypothetical protein Hsw_PA0028 [Hymenobacter swuensis DY53]